MATFTEDEIPVISLAGIDDDAHMAAVKKKIVEACEVWGIFQVVDHGVDPKLIDDMIRLTTEFYYLPPEEKLRFDMSGGKKGGFMISTRRKVSPTQTLCFTLTTIQSSVFSFFLILKMEIC